MKKLLKYLCPHTWFKEREVVFYGKYPYIDKFSPIIKSSEFKREWLKQAKSDFDVRLLNKGQGHITSVHRCLGMQSLFQAGFILKSDRDFAIETNGNDDEILIHDGNDIVSLNQSSRNFSFFSSNVLGNYHRLKGSLKHDVKYNSPWFYTSPKDIVILVLPIPYNDDTRFMACAGVLDPLVSFEINVIFNWFCENSYEVVKIGTPLAQLIPIPRKYIYSSFKMKDEVPKKIIDKNDFLKKNLFTSKCTFYSELKKSASKLIDL